MSKSGNGRNLFKVLVKIEKVSEISHRSPYPIENDQLLFFQIQISDLKGVGPDQQRLGNSPVLDAQQRYLPGPTARVLSSYYVAGRVFFARGAEGFEREPSSNGEKVVFNSVILTSLFNGL